MILFIHVSNYTIVFGIQLLRFYYLQHQCLETVYELFYSNNSMRKDADLLVPLVKSVSVVVVDK
jgi:hypothetical protein